MRCRTVLETLTSEWGSGVPLSGDVRDHLAGCDACAAESRRIIEALDGVSSLDVPDPGPEYWAGFLPRVRTRIAEAPASGRVLPFRDLAARPALWSTARYAAAAALLVVLAGAAAAWRLGWIGGTTAPATQEDALERRLDEALLAAGSDAMAEGGDAYAVTSSTGALGETDLDPDSLSDAVGNVIASLTNESPRELGTVDQMIRSLSDEETKALLGELKPEVEEPAGKTAKEESAG